MRYLALALIFVLGACTDTAAKQADVPSQSHNDGTLYVSWDGKALVPENGERFALEDGRRLLEKYPGTETLYISMGRSGLTADIPDLISQLSDSGFEDVVAVDSAASYTQSNIERPIKVSQRPLEVRLGTQIFWSDKVYEYQDTATFVKELTQYDKKEFVVVINVGDVEDSNLMQVQQEIEALGFETVMVLAE